MNSFEIIVRDGNGQIIYCDYVDCRYQEQAERLAMQTCNIVNGETYEVKKL